MLRAIFFVICALFIASFAAHAQQEPVVLPLIEGVDVEADIPATRFLPEWEQRPTGADFARNYPREAFDRAIPGLAELCCTPRPDRTLDCRVGLSWPREYPFDRASLAVARSFRMTQASYDAFQATPGAWMQVPIRWRHVSTGAEFDEVTERAREAARFLCRPQPGAEPSAP